MDKKKKIFPKIQKKIRWFLTDESWKITKKDALWLAIWSMILSTANDLFADSPVCSDPSWVSHTSWITNWHVSSTPVFTSSPTCTTWNTSSNLWCTVNTPHASWIVNWHFSNMASTPSVTPTWHCSHASHSSHSSHGSWGWC